MPRKKRGKGIGAGFTLEGWPLKQPWNVIVGAAAHPVKKKRSRRK